MDAHARTSYANTRARHLAGGVTLKPELLEAHANELENERLPEPIHVDVVT